MWHLLSQTHLPVVPAWPQPWAWYKPGLQMLLLLALPRDPFPLWALSSMACVTMGIFCPLPGHTWLWVCAEGPAETEAETLQPADPSRSLTHPGMCCAGQALGAMYLYLSGHWNHSQPCPLLERHGCFCCGSSHGEMAPWGSTHN